MQVFIDEADEDIEAFIIVCMVCDLARSIECRDRVGNILRDRAAAMQRYLTYPHQDFKRRFRMKRYQFEHILDLIRARIEPDTSGKLQAIRSSGSYVPAELRLCATMRILAGGSYLDAADLFAISASSIWDSTVWPINKKPGSTVILGVHKYILLFGLFKWQEKKT